MPWDDDSGDWQGLSRADQLPRYRRLAELVGSAKSVLDVGCGQGLLRHFISGDTLYLGIEPSNKARGQNSAIVRDTAEHFCPRNRWDCIVFNEMLYYSRNPIYLLHKYSSALTPQGKVIISIYQDARLYPVGTRLLRLVLPSMPVSNVHCSEMIARFVNRHNWFVLSDELIDNRWRMWAVRP